MDILDEHRCQEMPLPDGLAIVELRIIKEPRGPCDNRRPEWVLFIDDGEHDFEYGGFRFCPYCGARLG